MPGRIILLAGHLPGGVIGWLINPQNHYVVIRNHPDVLNALIQHEGCDLNLTNYEGLTSLHIAVQHGFLQSVDRLLQLGCNANIAVSGTCFNVMHMFFLSPVFNFSSHLY